jgi:hypothetical protein
VGHAGQKVGKNRAARFPGQQEDYSQATGQDQAKKNQYSQGRQARIFLAGPTPAVKLQIQAMYETVN